jgi:hypothetical protein
MSAVEFRNEFHRRQEGVFLHHLDEALFSVLLAALVHGLGDAVV